jgi:NAD(P)-dependent dehydrogenase (short-subunit alcohol dehydrogenase family)
MTRVSIVTGADGNLGRAVARLLHERGDRLVLTGRDRSRLEAAFAALPGVELVAADLTSPDGATAVAEAAEKRFGQVDHWCHLAGGFRMGSPVHETSEDDWSFVQRLNVDSLRHVAAAVVPMMLRRGAGAIVTVGAFASLRGVAGMGAYCAAKASVQRLTEAMSAELKHAINVNCVLPTILDTPENRAAMPDADPAGWVRTEDLAAVIAFLTSDAARAVHGVALPVTGKLG